jgi:hypothetical protein
LQPEVIRLGKRLDIKPGDRFGRLTILKELEPIKKARFFLCKCDCGTVKSIRMVQLTTGQTKSCGCFKRDHLIKMISRHGHSRDRLYITWIAMKARCNNPNNPNYKYYGGRGIKVCKEWTKFINFYNWAIASGYQDDLTIERKNVNQNYELNNCIWIPRNKQSENTRRTRMISYKGKTKSLKQWADYLHLNYNTLCGRLYRGWDIEDSFSQPLQINHSTRGKAS